MTTLILVVLAVSAYLGLAMLTGRLLRGSAAPAPVLVRVAPQAPARVPVAAQSSALPRT
jgi:hypothetical protein